MLRATVLFFTVACLSLSAGDLTLETGATLPDGCAPEDVAEALHEEGVTVKGPDGEAMVQLWGRKTEFEGDPAGGFGIRYDFIPEGALIGVVRFFEEGSDFREQTVPAGYYTLRYALHPEDGNHMGVAPSRDFAVLTPAEEDAADLDSLAYADLLALTLQVGNSHPTVARIELPEGTEGPNLWENDYEHWVLDLPVAGDLVGVVVQGHSEE